MTREDVARIAHTVNRAYCQALGDHSQQVWVDAPCWQRDSAMQGVALHLSEDVPVERSHEAWMRRKYEEGWHWGPFKNPALKEHPCLVPFSSLPLDQQAKDHIFRSIVMALAEYVEG